MKAISKEQIRRIYSMGARLGIKGGGRERDDELHTFIYGMTGKESVRELTENEFYAVKREMEKLLNSAAPAQKPAKKNKTVKADESGSSGMATKAQQNLCWRYCYRLKELDPDPDSAEVYERLKGAISKVLGTNMVTPKEPFHSVTQDECAKLIEYLKRYVNSAERKALKRGEVNAAGGN